MTLYFLSFLVVNLQFDEKTLFYKRVVRASDDVALELRASELQPPPLEPRADWSKMRICVVVSKSDLFCQSDEMLTWLFFRFLY